jgi:nucleoside 2-deoxyribosyltransferase
MRTAKSLIIVPFDEHGEQVLHSLRGALEEIGVDVFRLDNIRPGASWANAVTDAIRSSDFIVADVTRQNPNVYYELGLAHALRKPTILLMSSESGSRLPSDLSGFNYIVYEPDNLHELTERVKHTARAFVLAGGARA